MKSRSSAGLGFNPDPSAVSFHDFSGNCQSDSRTGVLLGIVKALKNAEDAVAMIWFNADAVIFHRETPILPLAPDGNMHMGRCIFLEFDGIGDQVLKYLGEQHRI